MGLPNKQEPQTPKPRGVLQKERAQSWDNGLMSDLFSITRRQGADPHQKIVGFLLDDRGEITGVIGGHCVWFGCSKTNVLARASRRRKFSVRVRLPASLRNRFCTYDKSNPAFLIETEDLDCGIGFCVDHFTDQAVRDFYKAGDPTVLANAELKTKAKNFYGRREAVKLVGPGNAYTEPLPSHALLYRAFVKVYGAEAVKIEGTPFNLVGLPKFDWQMVETCAEAQRIKNSSPEDNVWLRFTQYLEEELEVTFPPDQARERKRVGETPATVREDSKVGREAEPALRFENIPSADWCHPNQRLSCTS